MSDEVGLQDDGDMAEDVVYVDQECPVDTYEEEVHGEEYAELGEEENLLDYQEEGADEDVAYENYNVEDYGDHVEGYAMEGEEGLHEVEESKKGFRFF